MEKDIFLADSCAGGISVLKFFLNWCGDYNVHYLADGEKNPFGLKSKQEIFKIVESWLNYFNKDKTSKLFCISCNTASISIEKKVRLLERKYKTPIVTMIDGAKSIIKKNKNKIRNKEVLIIGTKFTITSGTYRKLILREKPKNLFELIGTFSERFVARGVEKNEGARKKMLKELSKFKGKKIDTIFLGCTCYSFISREIKKIYGEKIYFLDPAEEVSKLAKKIIHGKNKKKNINECHFYVTGNQKEWNKNFNIIFRKIFGKKVKTNLIY